MDQTLWTLTADLPATRRLAKDAKCDVCVVGAGIAGLTTAYRLAKAGLDVVVLDTEGIAAGESHHTSAHLVSAMDERISRIARRFGDDRARLVVESHAAAIDWIEQVARDEAIDCDFRRVNGYLFLGPSDDRGLLEREMEAARAAGLQVEWLDRAPVSGADVGPALSFANQAEFHPVRFLAGLAAAIKKAGGRIYGKTRVVNVEDGSPCGVETADDGPMLTANAVVLATNSPSNGMAITMKMVPMRTFLVAMRTTGKIDRALYWDTATPYHYLRLAEDDEGTLLLSGGGDYQAGTRDEGDRVYHELEEWTRARFPVGETAYRWSGQVMEPADWLGLIGRLEENGNIYVCTGDSGQGLTNGTIGGILIGDLIMLGSHPWQEVYSPRRFTLKAVGDYLVDAVKTGRHKIEKWMPGEVSSEAAVAPGHGAVLKENDELVALYRDESGTVLRRSAICTHAGCVVHWDSSARIWACPCHGSRFHPDGGVINGPATAPLAELEPKQAKSKSKAKAAQAPAPPSTRKRPNRKSGTPKR
jgi:glycine/D-amino acid oxidase-like deaminating enzyme/nitrite reductase/ring-hydroxylating ferredoxin subunit